MMMRELEPIFEDFQKHCSDFLLATQEDYDELRGHGLDALDARELVFLDVKIRVEALLRRITMWEVAPLGRGLRHTVAARDDGPGRSLSQQREVAING